MNRVHPMRISSGVGDGLHAHFEILARYNRWANARLYDAIAALGDEPFRRDVGLFFGSLHRTLNHILLADRIWLFRLTGEEPEQGPPGRVLHDGLAALERARIETDERLIRTVDDFPAAGVADIVQFRMANGLDVETSVTAVLSHLFNHQAHHRGQAHAALTILGAASVELDLLLFELECGAGSGVAGAGRSVDAGPVGPRRKARRGCEMTRSYAFSTVDVFTNERFGGNPLAVFTDGRGLGDCEMQAIAREMNLSETTFVLPPEDPANSARVRIFNRTCEMAFAGHPNVGTAFVLAASGACVGDVLRFEEPAGLVEVRLVRNAAGKLRGAAIDAPQPLALLGELDPGEVAACIGLGEAEVVTRTHRPVRAAIGSNYVIAEVDREALSAAVPDAAAFARTAAAHALGTRLPILLYCRSGASVRARMFAPLEGTTEDPATGGAVAALGALLLSCSDQRELAFEVSQGVEMGRPSRLSARAWREGSAIHAGVAGECVPVVTGRLVL